MMKKIAEIFIITIFTLAMTGCVSNYEGPKSGPTAEIINESDSLASFNLFKNAKYCVDETTLTNNFLGGKSFIKIPANKMVTLKGYADNDLYVCKDYVFSFNPKANHRYSLNFSISDSVEGCSLIIKDVASRKIQPFTKRKYVEDFWSGKGNCNDKIARD